MSEDIRVDVWRRWADSGLAALTGETDGAVDYSQAHVLTRARETVAGLTVRLTALGGQDISIDATELLAGRAALLGLRRRGRVSAGGASHLIRARDGWWALTLSRGDDVALVPALLANDITGKGHWAAIHDAAKHMSAKQLVSSARLLGLPAARLGEGRPQSPRVVRRAKRRHQSLADLLVVDLSSMWAGPLCTRLLMDAGATVVKVESVSRPDGARGGAAAFFNWMNSGKLSYAADFDTDHRRLRRLLAAADIVIEGSRPRALARRGLSPSDVLPKPGQTWLRITGHGAVGDAADWVAFGDDAAVAGGLVGRSSGGPVFCADAIADPLTGLAAASAVAQSLTRGGGELIELSMASVSAGYAAARPGAAKVSHLRARAPKTPKVRERVAHSLGTDTGFVDDLVAARLAGPAHL